MLPVVSAVELIDCGSPGGGLRLAIHQGSNIGGGRFGLRRFVRATRLVTQPALAASHGRVFLAWSNSDSPFFGDPTAGSNILFLRSNDGGRSWTRVVQVNPSRAADIQHVHPAIAIEEGEEDKGLVHISYYTQHANATVDLDLANSDERGDTFPDERVVRVNSVPFNLAPTNIPIPTSALPFRTTNYDRIIVPCYSLGEYNGLTRAGGKLHAVWGDSRNLVTNRSTRSILSRGRGIRSRMFSSRRLRSRISAVSPPTPAAAGSPNPRRPFSRCEPTHPGPRAAPRFTGCNARAYSERRKDRSHFNRPREVRC
jgi:hypothetical protein